jgi:hypothetical protein
MTEEGRYEAEEIRALVDRTPFLRDGQALLRGLSAKIETQRRPAS